MATGMTRKRAADSEDVPLSAAGRRCEGWADVVATGAGRRFCHWCWSPRCDAWEAAWGRSCCCCCQMSAPGPCLYDPVLPHALSRRLDVLFLWDCCQAGRRAWTRACARRGPTLGPPGGL
ncbi:hypothetical protein C2E23DRAFT_824440 [Lenzites betulinus]|nr:hypothetical protein C2E23DRAFT_824440 [Lenzites betulinus]